MKIVAAALIGLNWAMAHAQVTRCPNTCEQVLGALATEGDATEANLAVRHQVTVTGRHYDNSVGSSDAASQGVIRSALLANRAALRP